MKAWDKFKRALGIGKATTPGAIAIKAQSLLTSTERDPEWVYSFDSDDSGEGAVTASVWFGACMQEIVKRVRTVPLRVYIDGELAPDTHPLSILLKRPTPTMSQSEWLARIAQNLTTGGESYLEKTRATVFGRSALDPSQGLTSEIWPWARSAFEPVVPSSSRRPIPTGYKPGIGDTNEVAPAVIIHTLYPRPGSTTEGLAPSEIAEREISVDRQASEWQQTSLQNRGVPDGVFRYKDDSGLGMNDTQLDQVQARVDEYWTDLQRNHKPFVLGNNLDWVDLAKTAVELELIKGREFAMKAIAAVTGVPLVLFNGSESTFANLETAGFIVWDGVVVSILDIVLDDLNADLAPEYGPNVEIRRDMANVDAFAPIQLRRWDVADRALAAGVPFEEVNETQRLGYSAEHVGADQGFIATSVQTMTRATEISND